MLAMQTLTTLRAMYGLDRPARFVASMTALLLVDFQLEFFNGRLPVNGGALAVKRAVTLRAWARQTGVLVVHVRNVVPRADSPVFAEHSAKTDFVPALEPAADELVITKRQAGAFSGTELNGLLRARGIDTLVVAGIMTHLAVDTTARDGTVLGYHVVLAHDACATRALPSPIDGGSIDAITLHRVSLAALADRFADVVSSNDILALPVSP